MRAATADPGTRDGAVAEPVRRIVVRGADTERRALLMGREWLVTNGLGGYAAGTIGGAPSRRYHGMLIAALPPPHGRRVVLTDLHEELYAGGRRLGELTARRSDDCGLVPLTEFRLELGLPVWDYDFDGVVVQKRLLMPHGQNTLHALYRLVDGAETVRLDIALAVHSRSHDEPVATHFAPRRQLAQTALGYELELPALPALKLVLAGARTEYTAREANWPERRYSVEESRGYMDVAAAWTPGVLSLELTPARPAALIASTEPWDVVTALDAATAQTAERERRFECLGDAVPEARTGLAAELVLAADQFVVTPIGRTAEAARVRARGDEERSVIAGYHWFTDWGRDTMISLEGLTLLTGRTAEAKGILRTFTSAIRDGLIPNLFPEGDSEGLYPLITLGQVGEVTTRASETLLGLTRILTFVGAEKATAVRKENQVLIKTLVRDVRSLVEHANFLNSKANFLLDAVLGIINVEQNSIIKTFTVAAVALMPPTLVASIYGMNFESMPELKWDYGYPAAVVVMILSAILPVLYFRRKGWL